MTRRIRVNVPLLSAAMDTGHRDPGWPSRWRSQGGIGVIHKNLSIEEQASEVDRVKRSESGMIVNPITLSPEIGIFEALDADEEVPHLRRADHGRTAARKGGSSGSSPNRDLRFETKLDRPIAEIMTRENPLHGPGGHDARSGARVLHRHKVEKLLVVDDRFMLKGSSRSRTSRR